MKADDTSTPSIDRIAELQQLIANFGSVQRYIQFADKGHLETDVEHSYGLAITAWYLALQLAPQLDIGKILKYALAHDLVELHAGDTYIFDHENVKTKSDREDAALEQLKKDLPDFLEVVSYASNYKDKIDAEARFVYAVDKILHPLMVVLSGDTKFWKRNNITQKMHADEKNKKMSVSPEVAPYAKALNEWLAAKESFYEE